MIVLMFSFIANYFLSLKLLRVELNSENYYLKTKHNLLNTQKCENQTNFTTNKTFNTFFKLTPNVRFIFSIFPSF